MRYLASHENTARGTSDFPIELYYVDKNHPRYEMPFHWHMEYELMLVLSGEFSLSVDGQSGVLHEGDAAVISSGAVHGGIPSDCIYECLVFDLNSFLKNNGAPFRQKYSIFDADTKIAPFYENGTTCCELIQRLFDNMKEKQDGYEFSTIGFIWQLFGQLLKDHCYTICSCGDSRPKNTAQIKPVLNYIRKNYASPMTLSDLSGIMNMSSEHFCRIFHSITGKSPIDYLNYYRIECACELLCSSDKSITETAYSCGFNDLSYFNRLFRKYKKITPGNYRKSYLSGKTIGVTPD